MTLHTHQVTILNTENEEQKVQFTYSEGSEYKGSLVKSLPQMIEEGKITQEKAETIHTLIKEVADQYKSITLDSLSISPVSITQGS